MGSLRVRAFSLCSLKFPVPVDFRYCLRSVAVSRAIFLIVVSRSSFASFIGLNSAVVSSPFTSKAPCLNGQDGVIRVDEI